MSTKLEILKTYLESEGVKNNIINNLILKYYNKPNRCEFITDEGVYYVYDQKEVDKELYELSSEMFKDLILELRSLIRHESPNLSILVDEINSDNCIDEIRDQLDCFSIEDMEFLVELKDYFIYKEN